MRRSAALLVALAVVAGGCAGSGERIVVAAGTTIVDSGFIEDVIEGFVESGGSGDFSVIGVASAEALALLDGGAAQLAVTHAPLLEDAYLEAHPRAEATSAFTSRFVIVGPPGQSIVAPNTEPAAALAAIAGAGATFVSRGDGSGTHGRELELWSSSGVRPFESPWYVETGQGMGFTLQVADQRRGFALSEHGAYLASSGSLTLVPVSLAGGELLDNPYRVLVDAESSPAARRFADWLGSEEGAAVVVRVNERLFGSVVYRPEA